MNTKYILITVIIVVAGTIFSLMDGFIYLEKLIGIIGFIIVAVGFPAYIIYLIYQKYFYKNKN